MYLIIHSPDAAVLVVKVIRPCNMFTCTCSSSNCTSQVPVHHGEAKARAEVSSNSLPGARNNSTGVRKAAGMHEGTSGNNGRREEGRQEREKENNMKKVKNEEEGEKREIAMRK